MRPAARLQAAIELLDEIIVAARENGASADILASRFFSARRYAGSKDRRAIRDMTWDALRQFGDIPGNARSAFVVVAENDDEVAALFDGSGYGPAAIGEGEARAEKSLIPSWIIPHFSDLVAEEEQKALLDRAPLDLRVNALKADRTEILGDLPEAQPLDASAHAVRLPTGFNINNHKAMIDGLVEIQDLGSQLIADVCCATSEMTVLDLCAGAGGKSLALASAMEAKGKLVASDTNRDRLQKLAPRAQRAGATNIESLLLNPGRERAILADLAGKCDVVLVDAPCSGSGTWRRNPETRWRLTQDRLDRVIAEQAKLLAIGAEMVASGGHMIYAVCSLLKAEGREQVAQFLQDNKGWRAVDPQIGAGRADGDGCLLTPLFDGTDGFFLARLEKL